MRAIYTLVFILCCAMFSQAQSLYFPPLQTEQWDTIAPLDAGWCNDDFTDLFQFLDTTNTRAFIVLQNGKIVIEKYFHNFHGDSVWYWASAGKSLTAFLVGLAQEQGHLNISDPVHQYLGNGWTSCSTADEDEITVRHQLTMTTGFADTVPNLDCFSDTCLYCDHIPGQRWSYHNAPYTLLRPVLENATGRGINLYMFQELTQQTGITGGYFWLGDISLFISRPRSMARFGLLMQSEGMWNNQSVLSDTTYFREMITPSQAMNEAYGYLWWLNGTSSFMVPYLQTPIPGMMMPDASTDVYAAMGLNGQLLNIVPSKGLVVVRMGDAPTNQGQSVPWAYNNEIWKYLNDLICNLSADHHQTVKFSLYPNPANDHLNIHGIDNAAKFWYTVSDVSGKIVLDGQIHGAFIDVARLQAGNYILMLKSNDGATVFRKRFTKVQ